MLIRTGICRRWIRIWWWCRFWMLGDARRRRARRLRLGPYRSRPKERACVGASGLVAGLGRAKARPYNFVARADLSHSEGYRAAVDATGSKPGRLTTTG